MDFVMDTFWLDIGYITVVASYCSCFTWCWNALDTWRPSLCFWRTVRLILKWKFLVSFKNYIGNNEISNSSTNNVLQRLLDVIFFNVRHDPPYHLKRTVAELKSSEGPCVTLSTNGLDLRRYTRQSPHLRRLSLRFGAE